MSRKRLGDRRDFHLYLPVAMYDELDRTATERGVSMNALIVELLREAKQKRRSS